MDIIDEFVQVHVHGVRALVAALPRWEICGLSFLLVSRPSRKPREDLNTGRTEDAEKETLGIGHWALDFRNIMSAWPKV